MPKQQQLALYKPVLSNKVQLIGFIVQQNGINGDA